ncbi:MAG: hypothetical protein KDC52_16830, partial [Ignavibacteriae bacterium]|nr:hypothetical protein [Ignavibacteriota bacterium]
MNQNEIIRDIIILPCVFNKNQNKSIYYLLEETGYFKVFDRISKENIYNELKKVPEYVNEWLIWSENKRSSSGWYFLVNNNEKYQVGFLQGK